MSFTAFPQASLDFLARIRRNNTKEWFEAHREEYDKLILTPSRSCVVELGEHLQALVPTINATPKVNGSLFRIYRDLRFSKDKTPIKSRIGLIFWQGRGRRMQSSAFYLHFSPDELFVAAGIRKFSTPMLTCYREYINTARHREELHSILETMRAEGLTIPPPKYKRLPRSFDTSLSEELLTRYDSMYVSSVFSPEMIYSQEFIPRVFASYAAMLPLQQWVYEMTTTCES